MESLAQKNAKKQQARREKLEQAARRAGWSSFSEFCTAVKNGQAELPRKVSHV